MVAYEFYIFNFVSFTHIDYSKKMLVLKEQCDKAGIFIGIENVLNKCEDIKLFPYPSIVK